MTPIIRDVADLGEAERKAFENVLGCTLRDDQQVVLGVKAAEATHPRDSTPSTELEIPGWWNVYAGLSDEEIDELDAVIRQRANLSRTFEE